MLVGLDKGSNMGLHDYIFGTSGTDFREYCVKRRKLLIPIEQEGAGLMEISRLFRAPKNNQ